MAARHHRQSHDRNMYKVGFALAALEIPVLKTQRGRDHQGKEDQWNNSEISASTSIFDISSKSEDTVQSLTMSDIDFPRMQNNDTQTGVDFNDETAFFQNVPSDQSMYLDSEADKVKNAVLLSHGHYKKMENAGNEEPGTKKRKNKKDKQPTEMPAEMEMVPMSNDTIGHDSYDPQTRKRKNKSVSHISTQYSSNETELGNTDSGESGKPTIKSHRGKIRGKHSLNNLDSSEIETLTVIHNETVEENLVHFSHIEVKCANSSSSFDKPSKELPINIPKPSTSAQSTEIISESFSTSVTEKELEMNTLDVSYTTSISSESLLSHESLKGREGDVSSENADSSATEELSQTHKALRILSSVEEENENLEKNIENQLLANNLHSRYSNTETGERDAEVKESVIGAEGATGKPKKIRAKRKTYSRGTQIQDNVVKTTNEAVKQKKQNRSEVKEQNKATILADVNISLDQKDDNKNAEKKEGTAAAKRRPRKRFTRGTQVENPKTKDAKPVENSQVEKVKQAENKIINNDQQQNQNLQNKLNSTPLDLSTFNNLKGTEPIIQNDIKAQENIPGPRTLNIISPPSDTTVGNSVCELPVGSDSIFPTSSYIINIETDPDTPQDSNICISLPAQPTSHVTNINLHVKGKENALYNKMSRSSTSNDHIVPVMIDLTSESPKIKKEKIDKDDLKKQTKEENLNETKNPTTKEARKQKNARNNHKKQNNRDRSTRQRSASTSSSSSLESSACSTCSSSTCGFSSCSACHGSTYSDERSTSCSCSACYEESSSSDEDNKKRYRY